MERNPQLSKIASWIIAAVLSLALLLFSLLVVTSNALATTIVTDATTTVTPTATPTPFDCQCTVLATPIPSLTPTDTPTPTPHPKHKATPTPTPTPVPANNSVFGTSSDTPTPIPTPTPEATATPTPVDTATPDTSPTPTFTAVPAAAQQGSTPPGNQANRGLPSPLILGALGLGVLISLGVLIGLGWLLLRKYFAPAPQVTMPPSGAQPWGLQQHEGLYGNPGGFPFAGSGQNMPSNGPFPPAPGGYPPMNAPQMPFPSTNDWFRPPNEP